LAAIRTVAPVGIGAALAIKDGYPVINQLIPGTPAQLSGQLQPGDSDFVALAQGDNSFVDMHSVALSDVVNMVRGTPGTSIQLQVLPADAPPGFSTENDLDCPGPVEVQELKTATERCSSRVAFQPREIPKALLTVVALLRAGGTRHPIHLEFNFAGALVLVRVCLMTWTPTDAGCVAFSRYALNAGRCRFIIVSLCRPGLSTPGFSQSIAPE